MNSMQSQMHELQLKILNKKLNTIIQNIQNMPQYIQLDTQLMVEPQIDKIVNDGMYTIIYLIILYESVLWNI